MPYEKEINGLDEIQKTVGGLIQAIYPFQEEVALVCNENGIFEHLEFNRSIPEREYGGIFGTFFVCSLGEENFTSLTPEQMRTYTERFKKAEILVTMLGNTPVIIETAAKRKRLPSRTKHPPKPKKR